jgi:VCBS repeat-containing protein
LGNDADPDGDGLSAVVVGGPSNGTLTLNADGSFTYTPATNFNASDSFTYRASDGTLDSNTATVTITVTPVNDPPTAVFDEYFATVGLQLIVTAPGVLGNDTDPDGDPLSAVLVAASSGLMLNPDGSFTFTPAESRTYLLVYQASDGELSSPEVVVPIRTE